MIDRACVVCGKTFKTYPSRIKRGDPKYCSMECYQIAHSAHETHICPTCGKPFVVQLYIVREGRGKYCSKSCYDIAQTGSGNPMYGKPQSEEWAMKHGAGIRGEKHYNYGKHLPLDVRIKIGANNKRENNHNWKGGFTPLKTQIRNCFKMMEWRREVFKRDDYTCQVSGQYGGSLHAHHIVKLSILLAAYNIKTLEEAENCKELWDINNGLTVSKIVHQMIHRKRRKT